MDSESEDQQNDQDNPSTQRPKDGSQDFPQPAAKEYLLRCTLPRPAPWSRLAPQRLYAVIVQGEYRIAGAFSSDTTFQ